MAAECVHWTQDLEIGVPFIDADHRTLVSLLNQVGACVAANEESMTVGSVLFTLDEYARLHFSREEKFQEMAGYPGLVEHRRQHLDLLRRLDGVRQRFEADSGQVALGDVLRLIRDWFRQHVQGHDMLLKDLGGNREAAAGAEALRLDSGEPAIDWARLRILVVDDNPNFTRLIETVLGVLGVRTVLVADSARAALAQLSHHQVDVMLLDWVMEGGDGLEFAQRLRRDGVHCPIVMTTGFARADYRSRALAIGIKGFLEKPISARRVVHALVEALAG